MRNFYIVGLLAISQAAWGDYYSLYPPQLGDLSPKSQEINQYNWRKAVKNVNKPAGVVELPVPKVSQQKQLSMSLREAILLSLRNNPDVQSAELDRISQKFALINAHRVFEPTYSLTAKAEFAKGDHPSYSANSGIDLKTTLGTELSMGFSPNTTAGGGPGQTTFSLKQPLLKGFGNRINTFSWFNALDSENESRLAFKSSIIGQVVSVITAYRALVQDYQRLAIQKRTIKQDEKNLHFSELRYKVGQLAQSELLQQKAAFQSNKLSLLRQNTSLIQDRQTLLTALGLKASANIKIDTDIDFSQLKDVPSLDQAIKIALKNNLSYQSQLIRIRATERSLEKAKDDSRWSLDMDASLGFGGSTSVTTGENGLNAINPPSNPASLSLSLSIPINNVELDQAIVNANVSLEKAKLDLQKARLELVRRITNSIEQIQNQFLTLETAKKQVEFQRITLKQAQIKFRYGRQTSFEVNQLQDQLLQQENNFVSDKISLLNSITQLNQNLGITLDKWCINLRY